MEGEPEPSGVEELVLHAVQFNNSNMDTSRPESALGDMYLPLVGRRVIALMMPEFVRFGQRKAA
jgi:hypothetical protein